MIFMIFYDIYNIIKNFIKKYVYNDKYLKKK